MTIEARLDSVRAQIQQAAVKAGRDEHDILLLAISKTQPAEALREAFMAGQVAFGENYLQEALIKQQALADLAIEWHFVGPIQSNKTRDIAEHFSWVHSVDRLKIALRLNDQRPDNLPPLNICLQVNIDNENTKSGAVLNELPVLIEQIAPLPRLRLRGLMAIPSPRANFDSQKAVFEQLAAVSCQFPCLDTLSMGMSQDMEAAITAGSTIVRIGTAIFGPRAPKTSVQDVQ